MGAAVDCLERPRDDPATRVQMGDIVRVFADALREKEREGRRNAVQLARILHLGLVKSVYQPIVDIKSQRVMGFEALSRGPRGSGLEGADTLFGAATEHNLLVELDRLCRPRADTRVPVPPIWRPRRRSRSSR